MFKGRVLRPLAYLAQSPQFYKQDGDGRGPGRRVSRIGRCSGANRLSPHGHDTEFNERRCGDLSWITSHEDVIGVRGALLAHVIEIVN